MPNQITMVNPDSLMKKAQNSRFYKWVLNVALDRMIPFNKPHGFKVLEISDHRVKTAIPYKRKNFNHIRGLHATALATLSEFTTGLMLINFLGTSNYRIILQRLDIEYYYQGKMDATAEFKANPDWINEMILQPLNKQDSITVACPVEIFDIQGHKLTTATVHWQIKSWGAVKTQV